MTNVHRNDQLGIAASTACALHCALGPALVATAGALPLLGDERLELALALIACGIALFALTRGWLEHHSAVPGAIGALGISALFAARLVHVELEQAELLGSIAGSALLVAAHALNMREHERATCCSPELEQAGR
jgi:hypothetical protein